VRRATEPDVADGQVDVRVGLLCHCRHGAGDVPPTQAGQIVVVETDDPAVQACHTLEQAQGARTCPSR
jgi:hypothetical protein